MNEKADSNVVETAVGAFPVEEVEARIASVERELQRTKDVALLYDMLAPDRDTDE